MLSKLSVCNAKRQFSEYALFFVTLTCCVASMYAFNSLLFSDMVKALPDMELLPFLIVAASLLIIFVMGWVVSYMIHYMLKRRSKEFGIYMLSGISKRKIGTLIFMENSLIGALAFGAGCFLGMLFAQILEAVLCNLFGVSYMLHFGFSPATTGLTFLYFSAMILYSIRRNGKWICRVQLRDILMLEKQNEIPVISRKTSSVILFALSVLGGCVGTWLIGIQPIGKGYDILAGTVCFILFLLGFFISVPSFLVAQFGERIMWKYKKQRLLTFRWFTAKLNSTSTVMGILSVLFMLSIAFAGIGVTIGLMVTKNVEAGPFDMMILHKGEMRDFSCYTSAIGQDYAMQGHAYGIYSDGQTDFRMIYEQAVVEAGRSLHRPYEEFQYDTCMKQSDYLKLRELLGYQSVELHPAHCYVHCIPALKNICRELVSGQEGLQCAGFSFEKEGVFSEPLSQMNGYGNGLGYIIIVPDKAAGQMNFLYSVYAAVMEETVNPVALRNVVASYDALIPLDRSSAKSTESGAPTVLIDDNADYLSGKWMDKAEFQYLYAILICLFYLAFVLEITGAAILATQVLSDWQAKQRQERILRQLGMSGRLIRKLNSRQLSQIFLYPMIPAFFVSFCFLYICAKKILQGFFPLPIVPDHVWIGQAFAIALALFSLLYAIYYAAARISYGQRTK